jgi:positive regulator of sigma E activity
MQKYLEIRSLEVREKSEIGKMLVYCYEELVSSIRNQIKDGPCKDLVEKLKSQVLSRVTLQSVQLLATGKRPVFGNLNEQILKSASVVLVDQSIADILLTTLSQMFQFQKMWQNFFFGSASPD